VILALCLFAGIIIAFLFLINARRKSEVLTFNSIWEVSMATGRSKKRLTKMPSVKRQRVLFGREQIDPQKDRFARTEAYSSGLISPVKDELVEQHSREGYEHSSVRTVGGRAAPATLKKQKAA